MFSKTCEYAIRALIYVTRNSPNGEKVKIKDVAEGLNSPQSFTAKILQDLRKLNFVQSVKGLNGGFYMTEKELNYTLDDIVRAVDGDRLLDQCTLGLPECGGDYPCPIHHEMKPIKDRLKKTLKEYKLSRFLEDKSLDTTFLRQ
ncbi:MAG: Rrf2 family transcriptional regulator [Chitinophagales bacterium]|nr:Rrf2 family transcriptional regulator [Chitinophagales bacterium]